ncbi:gastrula zinc finger protein XlCGF8.2DB-like isoform X2 [Pempheris klunzingeri]|uniref:gastrula zinc finger protein XlCGF8.2DB-like isoform X2 n=1 Tax=Pempheris klunzingeri TaxID=3127111 RepID=UPI00398135AE
MLGLSKQGSGPTTDVQQLLEIKEEVLPEQQERSPSLDREEPPHIKEEEEELCTSREGEQPRGLEEAESTTFILTLFPVKSEDDEEKPQSLQLHRSQTEENTDAEHLKTECDREDCEGPGLTRNLNPDCPLQAASPSVKASCSSDPEADNNKWDGEPQSGLNALQNHEVLLSDKESKTGKKSVRSSKCATSSGHKRRLQKHSGIQTGVKPFSCSDCGKTFALKTSLTRHIRYHSEGKRFSCSVCKARFSSRSTLVHHKRTHTGEKPFKCSVCGKRFTQRGHLTQHTTVHTGEKPFNCSLCGNKFAQRGHLKQHLIVHTGEKPFGCSLCGKKFALHGNLRQHLTTHSKEKPYSCSVCGRRFSRLYAVKIHKCAGESDKNK